MGPSPPRPRTNPAPRRHRHHDYGASRAALFATLDRPALSPLPDEPYVFARWSRPRVAPDYHVEIEGFFYSVPFALIRETVDARATERADKLGPSVAAFCQAAMAARPHPEQGFRTCLGVLALEKSCGPGRLDAACQRSLTIGARSVSSIRSILKTGLDQAFLETAPDTEPLRHAKIRGQRHFH